MPAKGKYLQKQKASRVMVKVPSPSGDRHAKTIGSKALAHKAIIVQGIIRDANQAGAQSVALLSMSLHNVLAQSSLKQRMPSWMSLLGTMKAMNGMTSNGSRKSMKRPRGRKEKGKALSRKESLRVRMPRDQLLQDLHSLHRRRATDPNPNPNPKHAHAWQMYSRCLSTSPAAGPEERITDSGKYITIQSSTDIDWTRPLHEQLFPNLKGPRKSTSSADLCMLRSRIPRLSLSQFNDIYPSDNTIEVVQKSHGVHSVKMSEAAAWVSKRHSLVCIAQTAHDGCHMVSWLGRCESIPILDADIAGPVPWLCAEVSHLDRVETVDKLV